jgi:hypothetical protein
MNTRTLISVCGRTAITGAFALAFPLSGIAADNAPPETLNVRAFSDHYVAAGKPFADLAALEAWAKPILIRSVWLDFCYPVSTGQFVSTVERLHSAYSGGMQVRTLSSGDEGCVSVASRSSASPAHETVVRADAEYLATDEFGRGKLP